MQLHIFWLFLILTCFSAIESKSLDSFSRACSPDEQDAIEGKCSWYVNDLMYLTEEYPSAKITLAIAKNMSSACGKVTSCFGEFECAAAQKNKKVYERKCENLDFHNYDLQNCIPKFYEVVYNKSNACTIEYDFFSTDLKTRRDAYTKGKLCVVSIAAAQKCGNKALEFLNLDYEKFVDWMSVKPDKKKCNSLHDQLIILQCGPAQVKVESKLSIVGDDFDNDPHSKKPIPALDEDICDEIETCLQGTCILDGNPTINFSTGCNQHKALPFYLCEMRVELSNFGNPKQKCVGGRHFSNFNSSTFSNPITNWMINKDYLDDKECMRTMMGELCGNAILKNFDSDWDNYHIFNAGCIL